MNTFAYISSSIYNSDMLRDDFNLKSSNDYDIFIYSFIYQLTFKKSKIFTLYETLTNIYILKKRKEEIFKLFNKTKLYYNRLNRFARKIKIKKYKQYDYATDLLMNNKLIELNNNILFTLYDDKNKTKYIFRISDLMEIINKNLSNEPEFIISPLKIKNPFNNIPFNNSTLFRS